MSISPAPWRTEGYKNLIVNDANGNTIAAYPGCGGVEAGQANARLIAAAPRLLESLRLMVDMFERHIDGREGPDDAAARWDMAREAITAAELPQESPTT